MRPALFMMSAFVATALLGCLSLSALVHEFGYADDFIAWLWYTDDRFDPADSMFTRHGRYILSYLMGWTYGTWTDFGDLWKIRLLGIAGWGLAASIVFQWVLPNRWTWRWRAVHTSAAVLTPAVGASIAYSVCFAFGWGAAIALLGGVLAWRCVEAEGRLGRWMQGLFSLLCVVVAYMIYQPLAFFFLFPLLVKAKGLHWKRCWAEQWVRATVLFLVGTVFYGVIYVRIQTGFEADDAGAQRGDLAAFSFDRIVLLGRFLWWGLQSWGTLLPIGLGGGIGCGMLGLIILGVRRGPGWVITLVTLLAAVALPLVVKEVVFFTRLLVVVYAVFTFLALEGARAAFAGWVPSAHRGLASALAFPLLGVLAAFFAGFIHLGFVKPCAAELAWGREQAAALKEPPIRLLYVMPDCGDGVSWPGRWVSEYGRTISCVSPNARPFVSFLYWERFAEELSMPGRFFPGGGLRCVYAPEFEKMDAAGTVGDETVVWRGDWFADAFQASRAN